MNHFCRAAILGRTTWTTRSGCGLIVILRRRLETRTLLLHSTCISSSTAGAELTTLRWMTYGRWTSPPRETSLSLFRANGKTSRYHEATRDRRADPSTAPVSTSTTVRLRWPLGKACGEKEERRRGVCFGAALNEKKEKKEQHRVRQKQRAGYSSNDR